MSEKERLKKTPSIPINRNLEREAKKSIKETGKENRLKFKKTIIEGESKQRLAQLKETIERKQAPGKVHEKYLERIKKIGETTISADRETLQKSSIRLIRGKTRLLQKQEKDESPEEQITNLKQETARRIASYTDKRKDWYTINYQKVGGDRHERHIGLGDILLDPDIEEILVMKRSGEVIRAHRGKVAGGKYFRGRFGFVNTKNGAYIATFTGDRFKILSNKEQESKVYLTKYKEESEVREKYVKKTKEPARETTYNEVAINLDLLGKTDINSQLIFKAEKESVSRARVGKFVDLERKRPNLARLIQGVSQATNVPTALIYATFKIESSFRHKVVGDVELEGKSVGIGQFRPATWRRVTATESFKTLMEKAYPGYRGDKPFNRGENLYADIAASAILMKIIANKGGIDLNNPLRTEDIVYIRAGYNAGERRSESFRQAYLSGGNPEGLLDDYVKFAKIYTRLETGYQYALAQQKASHLLT